MPRKTTDKHTAAYIPYRCSVSSYDTISKIATDQKKPKSQVLRDLVEAGLVAKGYKQDEEHFEQLLTGAVKSALKPAVERLAAISAKAAQISGAAFFMNIYMGQLMLDEDEREQVKEISAEARRLGIEYLKIKDDDSADDLIRRGTEKMIVSDDEQEGS